MGKACSIHVEIRNINKILVGKPEGKSHLKGQVIDGKFKFLL
jgi:hypothetical protein